MSIDYQSLAVKGVQALSPYQPGKPIDELARELGLKPDNIIKLASNENPLGPSPKALAAVKGALDELCRYPDGNGFDLKQALSARYGVAPAQITLGNGSNDVLEVITRCFADASSEVVFSQYAFAVYPLVTQAIGAKGVSVPARDYGHDLDAMVEAITDRTALVFVANPNNPTGATAMREQLASWVAYAKENDALILFDAAYEAFIQDSDVPHSIYEIDGACECAIEFRSFSKNAGFTGTRCAFTVIPKELTGTDAQGNAHSLHSLWSRRTATKFNGTSYPIQKAAAAVYSDTGKTQVQELVAHYMGNAKILREAAASAGLEVFGGTNAPYIWLKTPNGAPSWDLFDRVLNEATVVITPGAGFGNAGEGYFRISAFNSRENAEEVAKRIQAIDW